jgi:hypothetical protein
MTTTSIKSDFNNAATKWIFLHRACIERMNDKNGVLSNSFFNSVAENFDKYFNFGPVVPFRKSDADDSFSALDLSIKDIINKDFGNAKLLFDNIFKIDFGINTEQYKTLDEIIKLGARNQPAVTLAEYIKRNELPNTLNWINKNNYKPNSIIIAAQNTNNFTNRSIRTNFMICFYKTTCGKDRVLLAGYKDADDFATASTTRPPAGPAGPAGPVGPLLPINPVCPALP